MNCCYVNVTDPANYNFFETRPIDGGGYDLSSTNVVLPTLKGTVAMVKNIDGGQKGTPFICFLSACSLYLQPLMPASLNVRDEINMLASAT